MRLITKLRIARLALALAALLAAGGSSFAAIQPVEEWFLMYKEETPIGYTHSRVAPLPERKGETPLVEIVTDIWIRIGVEDEVVDSSIVSREITTDKFRLVSSSFEWKMGDAETNITAETEEDKIHYTLSTGDKKKDREKEIDYPYGCVPLGAVTLLMREMNLADQASRKFCVLNPGPDGIKFSRLVIPKDAVKEQPAGAGGGKTFRVRMKMDGVPIDYLLNENGAVLEAVQPTLGFIQRRVDRSVIPRVKDLPAWNMMDSTATHAPGKAIPNPGELWRLKAQLQWSGVAPDELRLEAANQKVEKLRKRARWREALVSVERFHATGTALTATSSARFSTQSPLLKSTPAITSESPLVIEKTEEILKGATSTLGRIERLADWIYANIDPDPRSWSAVMTAEEVLKTGTGMDKHCAILFAAMARAAGIPTRIAAGKSYNFGFFVNHYWNEALAGDTWVPVDATAPGLSQPPLNIKFIEGNTSDAAGKMLARLQPVLFVRIVEAAGPPAPGPEEE